MFMAYQPKKEILDRYADVLINFALGGGTGIKKGETVLLIVPECAKPMLTALQESVLRAGGNYITWYMPDNEDIRTKGKVFYDHANEDQFAYIPKKYYEGVVAECDHTLLMRGATDLKALTDIDGAKVAATMKTAGYFYSVRGQKEKAGELTWTVALYGTEAMAAEAGLSIEEYWQQIIAACFLDETNPIETWKQTAQEIHRVQKALTNLAIETVRVTGPDNDLEVAIGKERAWVGGSGRNIPSFEIFTSPNWRATNGWIRFNQPLYYAGKKANGIELWFKNGLVEKYKALEGEDFLRSIIEAPNGNKVGEFSLTDGRVSRITHFMAETLYDENIGGPEGNTHIALGLAYKDCFNGDQNALSAEDWETLGYNESPVHVDMFSTSPRTATATLADGSKKVIYENGTFLI
jgi:aminopeptidase